jgi:hypothetical protein
MRPLFGFVTRALAVVFIVAGIGAVWAAFASGDRGNDKLILILLAVWFLVVGAGIGLEGLWAWWAGIVTTTFTVVMELVLRAPDGGWVVWSLFLAAFVISAVQGTRGSHAPVERRRLEANGASESFNDGPPGAHQRDELGNEHSIP